MVQAMRRRRAAQPTGWTVRVTTRDQRGEVTGAYHRDFDAGDEWGAREWMAEELLRCAREHIRADATVDAD